MAGSELLESTAEEVEADQLDALGCYHRIPTGWAQLG